jgi:hypothetical protein
MSVGDGSIARSTTIVNDEEVMRHGNKNNALGRKKAHRDALMSNMAISLIDHKRIETTLAKARALRLYVEPLITKSKEDTTHSRRVVFSLNCRTRRLPPPCSAMWRRKWLPVPEATRASSSWATAWAMPPRWP